MVNSKDEKWLKEVLDDCFKDANAKITTEEKRLLVGFSLLITQMLNNMEKAVDETQALWEKDPTARELREKFNSLEKIISYLRRYCENKIKHK